MASITQKRSVRIGASRSGRFSGGFGAVLGAGAWGGAGAIKTIVVACLHGSGLTVGIHRT